MALESLGRRAPFPELGTGEGVVAGAGGNQRLCWGGKGKEILGNCSTAWEMLQGWDGACSGRGFEV